MPRTLWRLEIMTSYELKRLYETKNPDGHFFDRDTMNFFGDRMSNFGVRKAEINGEHVWELYRKRPVKNGLKTSHYFKNGNEVEGDNNV
jgi:hypothetical protein